MDYNNFKHLPEPEERKPGEIKRSKKGKKIKKVADTSVSAKKFMFVSKLAPFIAIVISLAAFVGVGYLVLSVMSH